MRGALLGLAWAMVCLSASAAPLSVCLDYLPNPNHVPLYAGIGLGLFAAQGLDVELVVPGNASDPAKLAAAGRADLALTPQINYLIARNEGLPLVTVGVYIDSSLGGLLALAESGVTTPADLAGRPIGYSLAPLEPALWMAMLGCAGVDSDDVDLVNVGFNTVTSLLAGSVDAIGAFRNVEAIQVELLGRSPVFFAQEAFCVPSAYDLVFVANPHLVRDRSADVAAFLDAVEQSIARTRETPTEALGVFVAQLPELDDELTRRSFDATLSLFATDVHRSDPTAWTDVQQFLVDVGLLADVAPFEALVAPDLATAAP